MNKVTRSAVTLVFILTVMASLAQAQQPAPARPVDSVRGGKPIDVATMVRPIDMHDTVWMGELTAPEVRDLVKAGKTTALVIGGGVEENGPYMVLDKHNLTSRAMGEAIARKLGNALVAPIIPIEPGNPETARTPGAPVFSAETYKGVFTDIVVSLRTMGFKNIVLLGDSGGNLKYMDEVTKTLNTKWKGDGATVYFIEKYGNSGADSGCCGWGTVSKYKEDVLGVKEVMGLDGIHDDYYIEAMVMTVTLDGVRIPERIKAKKATINGIDLMPIEKTVENGRKLVNFRADQTVKEIQRLMAASPKTSN